MCKTIQQSILLLVFGLTASVFTFAQDEWRDINRDRRDIYRDRVDLREDYAKFHKDEMNHNWRAVQRDRADIYRDRADLRHDYADIREDEREYYRDHNRWRGRCVDPDHDGDCDFIRHRHRHYQNGWYGTPYGYSNPNVWRSSPAEWNRGWRNGRMENGNVPSGWRHGRKTGWGNSNLPKKSGW